MKIVTDEKRLLGPGPCNVSERVRAALARPMLGHLDPDFLEVMETCKDRLRGVFRTRNAATFPVSGTGSAGMEFLLVNFVEPGDRVVVGVNGVFGSRMANLAEKIGAEVHRITAAWGEALPLDGLKAAIDEHKPKFFGLVNGETSTGVYQSVDGLAEAVHAHGGLFALDCVTSLAGMPVEIDARGIDLAFSGTQKCLACPPGLAPVTVSERAREALARRLRPVPSFYLDLNEILAYINGSGGRSYHHTAPISMVVALTEALAEVLEEGLEARWERHAEAARYLTAQFGKRGFTPLVAEGDRLHPLTTLRLPEGFDETAVRKRLLVEHGIEVGAGLGPLAGKIWRIGLMGHNARPEVVDELLAAFDSGTP
ncbi:MAG: aminotransferase class V-fold PLP-dependent enzyme [Opitutales bacterium]|nr:aminotransferase class V-fold PLP-dependent enzyme [Opitutales bacterium]